jgi:prephenate dehydrogenase
MPDDAPPGWSRAAILGLGLMGASLGMALRRAALVAEGGLAGYDAEPGVTQRARDRGAIDRAEVSVADAVAGARLVVLAVPVLALRQMLAAIASHLAPDAIVLDVGSTKVEVAQWARVLLPDHARFVPTHPMTGRERSGVDAADPALYAGCVWCLTPDEDTDQSALAQVRAGIEALGAHPLGLSAPDHDAAVATISHLPLLAATALVFAAAESPNWQLASQLAAGGFRDTTRVASGDPRMARDIVLTNEQPILSALDSYIHRLAWLRGVIAAGETDIEAVFGAAKATRDRWLGTRVDTD